jgi:hypothetical protein
MKHTKAPIPTGSDARPLSFSYFIRAAAVLTLVVAVALPALFVPGVILYVQYGKPEVFYIAPFLWFLGVIAIWVGTLSVGCLVTISTWILKLCKRLARVSTESAVPQGRLWDSWIDGPQPLRP